MTRTAQPNVCALAAIVSVLLAVAAQACSGGSQATEPIAMPDQAIETDAPLRIELTLVPPEDGGYLDVRYVVRASEGEVLPDPLELAFPDSWAGRDDFFNDISSIEAYAPDGTALTTRVDADARVLVRHDGRSALIVRYRVRPHARLLTESTRFYALLNGDRFYAPGHAVFAQPLNVGTGAFDQVEIALGPETGTWALTSTLGSHVPEALTMGQLVNASFFGGPLRTAHREDGHHAVTVFAEEELDVAVHSLCERTLSIVQAQSTMLGPVLARETTVIVLRREEDPSTRTGNGREGGFVLELGSQVDRVDDELIELIAHENLHRLNGHTLTFAASDEFATLWFREGVTEYLAVRTAVQSGLIPPERLFQHIGTSLTMYRGNPIANRIGAETLSEDFWTDRDYRRLPYDKGALIGLLIDLELIALDLGGLEAFASFLRDDPSSRELPLTNLSLRDALERFSGVTWDEFWSDYVIGTQWLPIFERLNDAGLEVVERLEPAPYYGFRANVTASGEWYVSEVASDSPAERVGLREGLVLAGEPLVPDSPNGGTAQLRVQTPGGTSMIEVRSTTGQRRAYSIIEHGDGATDFATAFALP